MAQYYAMLGNAKCCNMPASPMISITSVVKQQHQHQLSMSNLQCYEHKHHTGA